MSMARTHSLRAHVKFSWRFLAFVFLAGLVSSRVAMAAPTVKFLTLTPSTIAGGSGASATGTVTLSEPAPAGGTAVALSSSLPALAASVRSVTVPQGATSATFDIGTNPLYRRYSLLAFNVTFTATVNGSSATAVLSVTAQPRPPDIDGDSVQRHGMVCGGHFPAQGGDRGVLYECFDGPDFGTVGKCTFRQECLQFGCQAEPSQNFNFFDECATAAPFPISISPSIVVGGNESSTATGFLNAPAPASGTDVYFFSNSAWASVPIFHHLEAGATQVSDTVSTQAVVGPARFAAIGVNAENPQQQPGGSTNLMPRMGAVWLTILPGGTPRPAPNLTSLTISSNPVRGGFDSLLNIGLDGPALPEGAPVEMTSSNPAVAQVPTPITVPGNHFSTFSYFPTSPVAVDTTVTITATYNGTTLSADLLVTAAPCTPTTCSAQGKNCGSIPNGCGGTLTCGSCTAPESCGGGGVANVCGAPPPPPPPGFSNPSGNAADSGGDGNGFESSPANAQGDDTVFAADNNSGSGTSTSCTNSSKDKHRFFNYGFSVPTGAAITGIEVRLDARADSTSSSPKMCVQLSWDGGTSWTAAKSTGTLGSSMASFTLGSSTDTWGRSWSAANFSDASFRVRVINVSSSNSRDFFLDWVGVRPHFTVPGPASLSAASVNPATVVGGNSSTGTATLTSAAPAGGAAVSLASSNTAAATVPASVTVAAGATSATFPVTTKTVAATTAVTVSATYAGVTKSATLTVNPAQSGDTVAIQRAEYDDRAEELTVEATSTSATATLQVFVTSTNQLIGTLTNNGGGRYSRTFSRSTNPQNITVRSSLGGSASRSVTLN